MAIIELKKIESAPLHEEAFMAVLRRYWRGRRSRLVVEFLRSGGVFGDYRWNQEKRFHHIRIVTSKHRYKRRPLTWRASGANPQAVDMLCKLSRKETQLNLLHTVLHELCHAGQRHRHGRGFVDLPGIARNPEINYTFDPWELEARAYANLNILKAWELYCEVAGV